MIRRENCWAEVAAMDRFGRGSANMHCGLRFGRGCVLGKLVDKGLVAKIKNLPCMAGYEGNLPDDGKPSEN